ncbi:10028_t:CDS:2 [Dentiscutata erythropus]|uniref:10028_t:CDS:1 n=1 Tax=Dentiscutata erythropus TaxID=1348616 RepID=A0A9N9FBF2_9GLOM|nr:10028_t:CDS:2 [Dentiscutata erythropus]
MESWLKNILIVLLLPYCLFYNSISANTEKEVFTSKTEIILESLFHEVNNWSTQEGLLTLKPPYTIQRYERVIPYKNSEEFKSTEQSEKEKWYILDELEEGKTYETRVSYASTSPTIFVLNIMDFKEAMKILKKNNATDEQGSNLKLSTTKKFLRARAIYDGVSIHRGRDSRPVIYNVVLETLVYGVPGVAINLILVLAIIIVVTNFIFVPKIYKALRNVIEEKDKKE